MRVRRPAENQELNDGPTTTPRLAASLIVLRESGAGPEVLLVKRNPAARFMGGAWVFPGGAVHRDETPQQAALRKLGEEAGISIDGRDAAALVAFSRWITPPEVKLRFDTFFFVAEAPAGAAARPDGEECVDALWARPEDALDRFDRGELQLVFPTIKHLEQLAGAPSVGALVAAAGAREVTPVEPRIVVADGDPQVVLPGEPGYDD